MHSKTVAMLSGGAAVLLSLSMLPADAAPRKHTTVAPMQSAEVSSQARRVRVGRVRAARTRTRIVVRRRSYLDPGTEVIPGESKALDYALPVGQTPLQVVVGPTNPAGFQNPWYPLPGPFFPWPP